MADKQIDDLNLPIAVVARIIKDVLPEGCNVSKEGMTCGLPKTYTPMSLRREYSNP